MAGIKRNVAPSKSGPTATNKRAKFAKEAKKPIARSKIKETETDSDPIVESDTTEHSGEDDGVSWPSDEDDIGQIMPKEDDFEGFGEDDDGGVKLPKEKPSARKEGEAINGVKSCMFLFGISVFD